MKLSKTSGATIAAAAAALIMTGMAAVPASAADDAKVHCMGVNACKGKSACKTATSGCAGMNACKGQGWVEMTAAECKEKGGTTK